MPSQQWFTSCLDFMLILCCCQYDTSTPPPPLPSSFHPSSPDEVTHWQLQRKFSDAPPRIGVPEPAYIQMDWVMSDEKLRTWVLQDENTSE